MTHVEKEGKGYQVGDQLERSALLKDWFMCGFHSGSPVPQLTAPMMGAVNGI